MPPARWLECCVVCTSLQPSKRGHFQGHCALKGTFSPVPGSWQGLWLEKQPVSSAAIYPWCCRTGKKGTLPLCVSSNSRFVFPKRN